MEKSFFFILFPFFLAIASSAQDLESSNLPILFIETNGLSIPDEPKVRTEMGLIYNGSGQRNAITDPFNEYEGFIGIEIRGATSQTLFDKKSYAFETRDEWGENRNVALLGMPKENDWVLHGPYSDKSLMRNALAYKIGESIMDYAPRTRFVEVLINGDYKGVYLLTEKIKRDKNRVNISKLDENTNNGDPLTGGYILKIDKNSGADNDGFFSSYDPIPGSFQQIFFQYHYPKPKNISLEQENYIQTYIHDFEKLMASDHYADSLHGYWQYIDVNTFIDFFLVNELAKNIDAYRLSTFLYKDRDSIDSRLKMGPVWDFNIAFGNVDNCLTGDAVGWVKDLNDICPNDRWLIPFWWEKLWKDRRFRIAVSDRWKELRQDQFSDQKLFASIDSMALLLNEAQGRNFERWDLLSRYIWPNWFVGDTYEEEVDYLKNWLEERIDWIEQQMPIIVEEIYVEEDFFSPIAFPNPFTDQLTFQYYIPKNESLFLRFFNAQGQLLTERIDAVHPNGTNTLHFNTSYLAPGIYFYQIKIGEEMEWSIRKVVKGY